MTDLVQIDFLTSEFNRLIDIKFTIIDSCPTHYLSVIEMAEMEVRLAKLTAELKRIDATRTFLITGVWHKEEHPEYLPVLYYSEQKEINALKTRIKELSASNAILTTKLSFRPFISPDKKLVLYTAAHDEE